VQRIVQLVKESLYGIDTVLTKALITSILEVNGKFTEFVSMLKIFSTLITLIIRTPQHMNV
jgi:hypothetical protein